MLQPRRSLLFYFLLLVSLDCLKGQDYIIQTPRKRRQDNKDVTTVLLVDSQGRSSFGRFLSVKPDLGLITSTARTFIQEGVTTEYATQVLGTTLDNGRLYAQLLTKSSRVLYDDTPSKLYEMPKKKWNLNDNIINVQQFIKNTDYISPSRADAVYVFPTRLPNVYSNIDSNNPDKTPQTPQEIVEEEILKESPSNNFRFPYEENIKNRVVAPVQNNVKVFKISPQIRDYTQENLINHEEPKQKLVTENFTPSKVRQWDNLPTFTVRNEFSPSGLSFLGDFPEFERHTERSKPTTPAERKAKLLFKAGLAKPNPKDFKSITYMGFADFTTTVGDTIIVFTPHTTVIEEQPEPSVIPHRSKLPIQPTTTLLEPPLVTKIETFLSQEPPMETKTVQGHKLDMKTTLPTMVIDKTDRSREGKSRLPDEQIDLDAKFAVLAHEQGKETPITEKPTTPFVPDLIEPSESQPTMLSTPSDEDISKILAKLQALHQQSTEPLQREPSVETSKETTKDSLTGATTIFFDDDLPIETTSVFTNPASVQEEQIVPTTEKETIPITTENNQETTEKPTSKQDPTTNEIFTHDELTIPIQETTPSMDQLFKDEDELEIHSELCTDGTQVVPTTVYKTLTYLTTFFIPTEDTTTTSIKSNEVISTETGFRTQECGILLPSSVAETTIEPSTVPKIEQPKQEEKVTEITTTEQATEEIVTIRQEITTLKLPVTTQEETTTEDHTTESDNETTTVESEDEDDEIEVIFKTLYTTYTYLTTYFQESTSSISSRIVVYTNVITSTLDPNSETTDEAVAGLFEREDNLVSSYKTKTVSFDDLADIAPSSTQTVESTATVTTKNNIDEYSSDESLTQPTPVLDHPPNGVKTYYTTYTYFTTIFVDGETEISSRTEVYTNYVTPSLPLSVQDVQFATEIASIEGKDSVKDKILKLNINSDSSYNTINRQKTFEPEIVKENERNAHVSSEYKILTTPSTKESNYVTLHREGSTTENNEIDDTILDLSEYETISTMVTDVRSSTSQGDRRIIDSVDKRNVLLDDQIVSESNNDSEIIPSPTLLLQTSYTTFTYFTTMYHGTTSSNIVSRLETVTNVVTQTLTPTQTVNFEDLNLPVTYFTTFTYWTTLYKDGTTRVTSREETVSNVETPTIQATSAAPTIIPTSTIQIVPTISVRKETSTSDLPSETIVPSMVGDDELTTYFTTYTYYTTSYLDDSTILNSRLETVTNVVNNSLDISQNQIGRAIGSGSKNKLEEAIEKPIISPSETAPLKPTGLLSTIVNTIDNNGTTTVLSTDVFGTYIDGLYAKILESTSKILTETIAPSPSPVSTENLKPTGVVSLNQGKIVDAEGISTLFYTTQALGTYIDNLYAQVITSTSSLTVDEEKKAQLPTEIPVVHRTGLVRLIEGSIVQNDTTTFYESKVLGTFIDGRYAQIIESTSSFLLPQPSIKPSSVATGIPSPSTKAPEQAINGTTTISPTPAVIEGSISESARSEEETSTDEIEEDENGRTKSRLTFQSKKRTFTPAIRPFASRQRPTFAPKRKSSGQITAATITRSDFTPTVTAVPASKSNRFGGRRSSSANAIQPTSSGRRFSRPKSTSSINPSSTGRRSSSRIQPTSSGPASSSRRGAFRSSSAGAIRPTSLFGARPRVRPTAAAGLNRSGNPNTATQPPSDEENDLTTVVTDASTDITDEEGETTLSLQTTETSRRNQNPLLRFRRPPLSRPPATRNGAQKTTKRPTTTTSTPRPRTTQNRPNSLLNRPRPNALFPRRGLFTTTTTAPEDELQGEEEEDDEESEDLDEEKDLDDTDYDSSLTNTQTIKPPTTPQSKTTKNPPKIKPFFRKRSKRDTYSRFRRPSSRTTSTTTTEDAVSEEITESPKFSNRNRFLPKSRGNGKTTQQTTTNSAPTTRKRISPSKASSQARTQFTLREKDTRANNFRRPTSNSRSTTSSPRNKSSRLRNSYHQTEASINRKSTTSSRRRTTTGRGRSNSRQRYPQEEFEHNYVIPTNDGTITVTHQIPTEVTIPVVNGGITEYKNVITAKHSTEILGPRQYSTSINAFGKDVKVLLSENTDVGTNGATLVTQFVLNEKPTTSIIFTPTYINRRKTSYSHVIPSTIYEVETVVNTIQPALAAQAPLANILLSQLLLGGLQPQPNALLGVQQPGIITPPSPTTEFKTRTTTYVTTITSKTSTVLPLTFRGKEILTTIVDSSVNVITATEFLTDTVVVTPPVGYQVAPQLNTALLLPLLQQQLQQQTPSNPLPANVFNLNEPLSQESFYLEDETIEEPQELEEIESTTQTSRRKSSRRSKKQKVEPLRESSIITLYVSGRTPGDFTTVLSTVFLDEQTNRRKREAEVPVEPSKISLESVFDYTEPFDSVVMPTTKDMQLESSEIGRETESLESIVGDVSAHFTTHTTNEISPKSTAKKHPKKYITKYVKASEVSNKSSDDFLS